MHYIRQEKLAKDKHSSLLRPFIRYDYYLGRGILIKAVIIYNGLDFNCTKFSKIRLVFKFFFTRSFILV